MTTVPDRMGTFKQALKEAFENEPRKSELPVTFQTIGNILKEGVRAQGDTRSEDQLRATIKRILENRYDDKKDPESYPTDFNSSVVFKQLELHNFKQLVHTTFEFSENGSPTLIYGDNGTGKSTLSEAIRWLWSGGAISTSEGNATLPAQLFSMYEPTSDSMRVTLELNHNDTIWQISRSWTEGDDTVGKLTVRDLSGNSVEESEAAQRKIDNLIPKELLTEFVLFDGARLQRYSTLIADSQNQKELSTKIKQVLGLSYNDLIKRHLTTIKGQYQSEINKLGTEQEQKEAIDKYEISQRRVESKEDEIKNIENQLNTADEEFKKWDKLFQDDKAQAERRNNINRKETDEAEIVKTINQLRLEIREESPNIWKYLLSSTKAFQEIEEEVKSNTQNALMLDKKIYATELRKQILSNNQCEICFSTVTEQQKEQITAVLESGNPNIVDLPNDNQTINHQNVSLAHIDSITRHLPLTLEGFKQKETQLEDAMTKLLTIQDDLKTLRANSQSDSNSGIDILTKRSEAQIRQNSLQTDLRNLEEELQKLIVVEQHDRDLADKKTENVEGSKELITYRESADIISDIYDKAFTRILNNTIEDIERKANQVLKELLHRYNRNFNSIRLTEEFIIEIKDESGERAIGPSSAQAVCLALSLYMGIQSLSLIQAPLIFDSAFVNLDRELTPAVAKHINSIPGQIVILHHDGELSLEDYQYFTSPSKWKIERTGDEPSQLIRL